MQAAIRIRIVVLNSSATRRSVSKRPLNHEKSPPGLWGEARRQTDRQTDRQTEKERKDRKKNQKMEREREREALRRRRRRRESERVLVVLLARNVRTGITSLNLLSSMINCWRITSYAPGWSKGANFSVRSRYFTSGSQNGAIGPYCRSSAANPSTKQRHTRSTQLPRACLRPVLGVCPRELWAIFLVSQMDMDPL